VELEKFPRLIVSDGRVMVLRASGAVPGLSIEILRLADTTSARPAEPIRFHETVLPVGLRLVAAGNSVTGSMVAIDGGRYLPLPANDDHVLSARDWFPLDPEGFLAATAWLSEHDGPIDLGVYAGMYRGLGEGPFTIVDTISESDVESLLEPLPAPKALSTHLYPYQQLGLSWLGSHSAASLGGILADEMGLGKTPQAIALLAIEVEADRGPNLVVMPLTLLENWARELRKFAPAITFYRHRGPSRARRPGAIRDVDVVLTTYDMVVADVGLFDQISWNIVISDEAQSFKNPETQRAAAIRRLNSRVHIALTGTPLENRSLDLWSIASIVEPGFLGDRDRFEAVLENDPDLLRRATRPLMLRREVSEVAQDLPNRIDIDVPLEMFEPERRAYERLIHGVQDDHRGSSLALLTRLRQYTAHPHSIGELSSGSAGDVSAKLTRLVELAEEIFDEGEKILAFVAFRHPADIVARELRARFGVPAWVLDGRIPPDDRQPMIDRFNEAQGAAVLVANPVAAGLGLNITGANHVIHFTLEWNPAKEDQATARAWRKGQKLPVTIHRLYYVDAIDELILERLVAKRQLIGQVVQPTGAATEQEVRMLVAAALEQVRHPRPTGVNNGS
jgi:SNF2 family DNA or RNA helicase